MELSKQVVSLDQAKRLKELGVNQESLFKWVNYSDEQDTDSYRLEITTNRTKSSGKLIGVKEHSQWSAFTVAELGEMLPKSVSTVQLSDHWGCFHQDNTVTPFYHHKTTGNTEADARAKMLTHLIEHNLINQ